MKLMQTNTARKDGERERACMCPDPIDHESHKAEPPHLFCSLLHPQKATCTNQVHLLLPWIKADLKSAARLDFPGSEANAFPSLSLPV